MIFLIYFFSNEKFFKYSQYFFGHFLNEFIDIKSLKNNCQNKFLNIPNDIEEKLDQILSYNNNKFNENLLFYFEAIYENFYFTKIIDEQEDKKLKFKKILEDNTLETVIDFIKFYEENKNKMNIQLIYRIAFIKIYFRYFANILYECKNGNEYIDFDNLVNKKFYLSSKELSLFQKDINIYISNILNIKCKEENCDLNSFIHEHKLTYLEEYSKEIGKKGSLFLKVIKIIPNRIILKEKFNADNTFKQKYPLLNYCLNKEQKIKCLKQIPIINCICNLMLDIFSYKSKEIEESKLKDEIINIKEKSNFNFDEKIIEFIKSYNYLLNEHNFVDDIIPENDYQNISIKTFLVSENNNNNKLNYIYNKFIEYQNKFLKISKKYFENKNLNEIETINVQEARKENIPRINDEFLEILINNSSIIENNKKEIDFDLNEIENELVDKIIPGLKYFNENKIRIMKYSGEEYNEIDEQILIDFNKRYKPQNISSEHKNYVNEFIEKNKDKKNLILLSLQYLMFFILSYPKFNGETYIKEVIDELSKNNNENEKIELIKSFFGESNINQNGSVNQNIYKSNDTLDQMNGSKENERVDTVEEMNNFIKNERVDTVEEMNNWKENEDFKINNLYSIFLEIKNKQKLLIK